MRLSLNHGKQNKQNKQNTKREAPKAPCLYLELALRSCRSAAKGTPLPAKKFDASMLKELARSSRRLPKNLILEI
jgi:hypothetical protein